jgi:hypothetical protein
MGKIIVLNRRNFEAIFGLRRRDRIYGFFGRILQWVYCGWHKHVNKCRYCRIDCLSRRGEQDIALVLKNEAI